jgi:hypothetical protein
MSVRSTALVEFPIGVFRKCRCGKASWSAFNGPELIATGLFYLDEPGKADPKATIKKEK